MGFWNWLFGRKKEEARRKKKKILLGTLIPISLIVIASGIFVGYWYGSRNNNSRSPIDKTISITSETLNDVPDVKITQDDSVWISDTMSVSFGENLVDLKKLSEIYDDITNFTIHGIIDFGFLIDFDMSFRLYGSDNSLISLQQYTSLEKCGVVIGSITQPPAGVMYVGDAYIDKSIHFDIENESSNSDKMVVGVMFGTTIDNSHIIIDGFWKTKCEDGMIVFCSFYASVIRTTFVCDAIFIADCFRCICMYFAGSQIDPSNYSFENNTITINGLFTLSISSTAGDQYGICAILMCDLGDGNFIKMDGAYFCHKTIPGPSILANISSTNSQISHTSVTIEGVFSCDSSQCMCCMDATSEYFIPYELIINATCLLGQLSTSIYGAFNATSNVTMTSSNFFSTSGENTYWQQLDNVWNGSYRWNGHLKNKDNPPNDDDGDPNMKFQIISNVGNDLSIIVIQSASGENKNKFNSACKQALQKYLNSNICPTTATNWLQDIVNSIL